MENKNQSKKSAYDLNSVSASFSKVESKGIVVAKANSPYNINGVVRNHNPPKPNK
jgi:hypothetical protein